MLGNPLWFRSAPAAMPPLTGPKTRSLQPQVDRGSEGAVAVAIEYVDFRAWIGGSNATASGGGEVKAAITVEVAHDDFVDWAVNTVEDRVAKRPVAVA